MSFAVQTRRLVLEAVRQQRLQPHLRRLQQSGPPRFKASPTPRRTPSCSRSRSGSSTSGTRSAREASGSPCSKGWWRGSRGRPSISSPHLTPACRRIATMASLAWADTHRRVLRWKRPGENIRSDCWKKSTTKGADGRNKKETSYVTSREYLVGSQQPCLDRRNSHSFQELLSLIVPVYSLSSGT